MIRCLHVIDHLGLGGAQSSLLDLVTHFEKTRINCEVAVLHGRGPFAEAIENAGVPVHSLAESRLSPAMVPNLLSLARRGGFDVFHFHLQGSNWLAKPVLALAGHGIRISHDHASGDLGFRGWSSLVPDALTHLYSHRVLAVSEGVRDFLLQWEALPPDLVETVRNGVNTSAFSPPDAKTRAQARSRLGLEDKDFVVGAMGRFSPEKNFGVLAEIAADIPESIILLAGSGPEQERITASIAAGPAASRVRLIGQVHDRAGFYAALDAFVLPSLHEGLPMVLLEAMAGGIPVVASRLPDIAAVLDEGRYGLLADPHEPASFSRTLNRLARDENLRCSIAQQARRQCERCYSAGIAASAVERLYFQLLDAEVARGQGT